MSEWEEIDPPLRVKLGPSPSMVLYDIDSGQPLDDRIRWGDKLRMRLCESHIEITAVKREEA